MGCATHSIRIIRVIQMPRFMTKRTMSLLAVITGVFMLAACAPSKPTALPLTRTFDKSPTGFEFKYPDDWDYTIPIQGVLLAGPRETLAGASPGPLFTVQRGLPISIPGSLTAALDSYLENGPLSDPEHWRITEPARDTTFDGRPARVVDLQGQQDTDDSAIYSQIIATTSENTFVYMFILTVPVDLYDRFEPTMNAMLDSVRLLE